MLRMHILSIRKIPMFIQAFHELNGSIYLDLTTRENCRQKKGLNSL
jgi:hypothetical protein